MVAKLNLPMSRLRTSEVLAFAFDELGTCKYEHESWATTRHGLCRVLGLIAKYGGALTLRSGDAEVIYIAEEDRFRRMKSNLGYEPQGARSLAHFIRGSQLQLIIPLVPLFDRPRTSAKPSILELGLPDSFRTQPDHFRGHLVPLLERLGISETCVGREELLDFRSRCEKLSRDLLLLRPRYEPFIFDFSTLRWKAAQFETFLYLMQNVLQHRPTLLVEVDDALVEEVLENERKGVPTSIDPVLASESTGAANRTFGELAESRFLETYSGIHATVMAITRKRIPHIFGLPSAEFETALISLLEAPVSIEDICRGYPQIDEGRLRGILTTVNPLFENKNGLWSLTWSKSMIEVEMERAILSHFDSVALRSKAWRGRFDRDSRKNERFYIPWSNVWRREFLEASRILNRGRQVDEIAQRLLFRLGLRLAGENRNFSDVKVLVCVSAPAMLLATALHRWWPERTRPAVADLGHYTFFSDQSGLPIITNEGGIVLVQDVLDDGLVTRWVVESLRSQGRQVLFILAFVRFPELDGGDKEARLELKDGSIGIDSLVEIDKPIDCSPPQPDEDDTFDYWVEPRSLRPVRFTTLRREFEENRDLDLERRNEYLHQFDNSSAGCLIMAGHFVYGLRHFAVTVDIRRSLEGEIGDQIARWVADVCEGGERERMPWERKEGYRLKGDVTAVLMPLYSQIHYLWTKVENILAQRGRRQPMWLLEPALFTGSGPGYRLPLQLRHQLEEAVRDMLGAGTGEEERPLRFLVLDDAIASGRTATTILATIVREIQKIKIRLRHPRLSVNPVEWIRYFALLNQSDHASHLLWRNVSSLGEPAITFVLEEYAPFMGVTVYNESDCPVCRDRSRLRQLLKDSEEFGGQGARGWIADRIDDLVPVAIDGAEFREPIHPRLRRPLDVLAYRRKQAGTGRYQAIHVDTAIWRFYELMYLSYPPSEVLRSLQDAWPTSEETDLAVEYERYRWAVYEWCVRHWRRVVSDSAAEHFYLAVSLEIERATGLVEQILEAMATRYKDDSISELVLKAIVKLGNLETGRIAEEEVTTDPKRIKEAVRLDTALQLFFFNAQRLDRERDQGAPGRSSAYQRLVDGLDRAATPLDKEGHSLLRNLHRRLMRPSRFADPGWALEVIAESLFRGRSEANPDGSHKLLPRLLADILKGSPDLEDLRLLHGSLVLFLAALEDIEPYADFHLSPKLIDIKVLGEQVLEWLRTSVESRDESSPSLLDLHEALGLGEEFCAMFNEVFHRSVADILRELQRLASEDRLDFSVNIESEGLGEFRVLTHIQRLILTISNRAIDPADKGSVKKKSRIVVCHPEKEEPRVICFKIQTEFADARETARLLAGSRNTRSEEGMLEIFGVRFDSWTIPSDDSERLLAENKFYVPVGFNKRSFKP